MSCTDLAGPLSSVLPRHPAFTRQSLLSRWLLLQSCALLNLSPLLLQTFWASAFWLPSSHCPHPSCLSVLPLDFLLGWILVNITHIQWPLGPCFWTSLDSSFGHILLKLGALVLNVYALICKLAEFQRIARRDKKAFFSDKCKEIEENNRMGKTRHLFKKIRDTKGTFHAKMSSI